MGKSKIKIGATPALLFTNILKWLLITVIAGILIGTASAFFLIALNWVTNYREANVWITSLLPVAGLAIGLLYHYWGKEAIKGNNLLLEEYHQPLKIIPFIMVPLVLFGTLATHLFGGSAGREGTAVQMGGAIADRLTTLFKLTKYDRQLIIIIGVSAGFASVFGTPLAAAVFAIEIMSLRNLRIAALLPSLTAAFISDHICGLWGIYHTHYTISFVPELQISNVFWAVLAGVVFGLSAWLFVRSGRFFTRVFSLIKYPPLRPFAGGAIIAATVYAMGTTRYIGLGIPTIAEAFTAELPLYMFAIKLLLTTFTLSAGFKGGEVTPLFFIGATLGSAMALYVPLPVALLAGMGFVAVFSGAANTPLACSIMGMELFGAESGLYFAIACCAAYFFAGHTGIYASQQGGTKHLLYLKIKKQYLKTYSN